MAIPRASPFIWATWLAKLMAGDCACHWQSWFQTHNQLAYRQPVGYDLVGWKVDHTRRLSELAQQLATRGLPPRLEYTISLELPQHGAILRGAIDCLVEQKSQVAIYDCKIGEPRPVDQIQVMIYLHCLAQDPRFSGKKLHGAVLYKEQRSNIPALPESFASNFEYFVGLLCGATPPVKTPGEDCRYCPITRVDCAERFEG